MSSMEIERVQDLSVYYWLKDLFSSTTYMNIVDEFPMGNLIVPTIAVEASTIDTIPYELGSKKRLAYRMWIIDIFAKTKSQRDEIGYKLLHELENGIQVYDYNQGFPPEITPPSLGCLQPEEIKMEIIKVFPELTEKLYWRATISFVATYSIF